VNLACGNLIATEIPVLFLTIPLTIATKLAHGCLDLENVVEGA
jgi:hypothetical protein